MDSASSATRGARWILFFNIFQKLLTFGMNQVIVRHSSPEVFGIAAVQLELLLSTLLFLSREGIRLALLRSVVNTRQCMKQFVNMSWLPALLVTLVTVVIYSFCPSFVGGMDRRVVLLYCSGALLESLGEPLFNLYNLSFRVDCRLKADAAAILFRSGVTFTTIIVYDLGIVGFGLAQLGYGLVHVMVMLWSYQEVEFSAEGQLQGYRLTLRDLMPCAPVREEQEGMVATLFGSETTGNVLHMTGTSLLKHALTEADKIALSLSTAATHYDQGVYGVINNYGSLVARMIFQPLEETARITFSKMAAKAKLEDSQGHGEVVATQVAAMSTLVSILLKMVGLFSMLFPVFGPFYARVAVQYGLGSRWYSEQTVQCLAVYCVYILALGLNGVSEAFVYATAPAGLLGTVNSSLVVSSGVFAVSSVLLIDSMGTSGILWANIVSMMIRILFNLVYTQRYFAAPQRYFPSTLLLTHHKETRQRQQDTSQERKELKDTSLSLSLSPLAEACICPADVLGMAVAAGAMQLSASRYSASSMNLRDAAQHVTVGAICFSAVLLLLYKSHGQELTKLISAVQESKAPTASSSSSSSSSSNKTIDHTTTGANKHNNNNNDNSQMKMKMKMKMKTNKKID